MGWFGFHDSPRSVDDQSPRHPTQAENAQYWFNYQLGADANPLEAKVVGGQKDGLFTPMQSSTTR